MKVSNSLIRFEGYSILIKFAYLGICKMSSQVKSSHIHLYSAFHNTDCIKAASQ